MTHRIEMRIANDRAAMKEIAERVERFGAQEHLPPDIVNEINLVLDEALNNIISYGYAAGVRGGIAIRICRQPARLLVEIEDEARPFDPLTAPPPDLTSRLAERRVGGLGIHFIKQLMDEVSYVRTDRGNLLKLTKNLAIG